MLRKSSASTFAATVSSSRTFANTFRDHLEQTLEDVVAHASELAHHCGRQRVQKHDVAQAMTNLCIMCESYHIGPSGQPVCKVLSTSKTIGGAGDYKGSCDDHRSQCMSVLGSCSISGGGRTKRKQKRRRRQKHGGIEIHRYNGYCDNHPSQCTFGEDLVSEAIECAASGGSKRRLKRKISTRKQKRGGGDATPKVQFVVKSVIKEFGKANYDVSWTEESLRLLERGIQFHVKQVLKETKEDNLFNQSKTMALKRVLNNVQ